MGHLHTKRREDRWRTEVHDAGTAGSVPAEASESPVTACPCWDAELLEMEVYGWVTDGRKVKKSGTQHGVFLGASALQPCTSSTKEERDTRVHKVPGSV